MISAAEIRATLVDQQAARKESKTHSNLNKNKARATTAQRKFIYFIPNGWRCCISNCRADSEFRTRAHLW